MESSAKSQSGVPPPAVHPDSPPGVSLHERFARLHERAEPEVFSFILRRVGNYATAMELTQETFLRIWRARDRIDPSRDSIPIARTHSTGSLGQSPSKLWTTRLKY
jgi:hypothetical protein